MANVKGYAALALVTVNALLYAAEPRPAHPGSASDTSLPKFVSILRSKAKSLEGSTGMRLSFQSFTSTYKLRPESVSYPDYVMVRLLYEATRDAGFWNLHWTITNQPPNSDKIWQQWRSVGKPSSTVPTASAECDELSALYAFLAERAGIKGVGLFWPAANHTVAVWVLRPAGGLPVRVVVPTSQIFLDVTDSLGTRKFDPWKQKTIYEYSRRDAADSFEIPKPLFDFFLSQADKYAGASDSTLQELRYLREGVFRKYWTPEDAARDALKRRSDLGASGTPEDLVAFQNFAQDMRSGSAR
ncbi:MAG TPA: hypothetical protein VK699_08290 [Terriglobales bacterium]|jgi:hypothetical protein|nr:hypothetical protein [Terriglobales bacterium]